jgi:hypothetical protein
MSEVVLYDTTTDAPVGTISSKSSSSIPSIPNRDLDVLDLSKDVIPHWEESGLKLLKTPIAVFKEDVATYEASLMDSSVHKAELSPAASQLEVLDSIIEEKSDNIKAYLKEVYGRNEATKHYSFFGFVYKNNAYNIPKKQNKRLQALAMMLNSFPKYEFSSRIYGLDFWQSIYDQYASYLNDSKSIIGNRSYTINDKNALKEKLQYKLRMIIKMIECNYEEDAPAIMRKWGFQKERYR